MRIALAQLNSTIGAFAANVRAAAAAVRLAAERGADLVLLPELALCGYPPKDLLRRADFRDAAIQALRDFARADWPIGPTVILGTILPHEVLPAGHHGAGLFNAAIALRRSAPPDGSALPPGASEEAVLQARQVAVATKSLLPQYDIFDEGRWFDPGEPTLVDVAGRKVGLTVCEDLWNDPTFHPHRRYAVDPVARLVAAGAELIVNVSASPFAVGKAVYRRHMIAAAACRHGVPIALCNAVGGQDGVIFDGHGMVVDAEGALVLQAPGFVEGVFLAPPLVCRPPTLTADRPRSRPPPNEITASKPPTDTAAPQKPAPSSPSPFTATDLDDTLAALVLGTRDYFRKTGFSQAFLGLSGGVDSALVAWIAAEALGPQHVTAVAMPSRYTAAMSNEDAEALARRLGIGFRTLPIEPAVETLLAVLRPSNGSTHAFGGGEGTPGDAGDSTPDIAAENVQARVRGLLLMALANREGALLLSTGNKSELAVGYCTLYGDMCGALAVIGDVYKTVVYALCQQIDAHAMARGREPVFPPRILTRPPSAELRPDQTDQDSLPPYSTLDAILRRHLELDESAEAIAAALSSTEPAANLALVQQVMGLVRRAEFKRRQAAPVLRIGVHAFGEGRRMPIAEGFTLR